MGSGGFAETYLAEDLDIPTNPKPKCVVKRLQPNERNRNIPTSDILRLFQKEGEILYQLSQSHNHIPKLYAYFEEKQEFYLVQEFIDGHDLLRDIAPSVLKSCDRTYSLLTAILATIVITAILTSLEHLP